MDISTSKLDQELIKSGEHVICIRTHNVNSIIQTWRTFLKIAYSLYSENSRIM